MADEKKLEKSQIAEREEEILKFWQEHSIFKKSLEKPSPKGEFVFYDGPPFATGQPHYGHILPGTIKDVLPRFKTMQGYHVARTWGWDCHGLPIENLIEKELNLKSKKDIEEYGIEKFNEAARQAVLRFDADWKKIIPRTGRWIDMDLAYLTMQPSYTESIWWSFKTLHEKKLIYQGFKPMHICPHCETTLSNFEVSQNYRDITDISVYVKFELEDELPLHQGYAGQAGTYMLAWTTTPWTLPGNAALAVKPEIEYVKVKTDAGQLILAKELLPKLQEKLKELKSAEVLEEFTGEKLVGKKYKPVFPYYINADLKNKENAWKIVAADFVTTTDGTGVVHIAPAFGEDDYNLSLKENLPFIQHVGMDGRFKKEVTDFAGMLVKPKDTQEDPELHQKADIEIIKYLAKQGSLFAKEKITHSYPHCWRCDTPLLSYAASSWFVNVSDFKNKLVSENSKVNWVPPEIGEGRFGKWLEGAKDWAISRSRFWGAPLPVWICQECEKKEVIGSLEELKEKTKSSNTYFVMRHGEAENNVLNILSDKPDVAHALTEKGKQQIRNAAQDLKDKKIDLIISSHFVRTKETAELVAKELGVSEEHIVFDPRLAEYNFGDFNGKSIDDWHDYWKKRDWNDVDSQVPHGESPTDMQKRIVEALNDLEQTYHGKTILIISHDDPLRFMLALADAKSASDLSRDEWSEYALYNAEVKKLEYSKLPRNRKGNIDFHRPYIDEVVFDCTCGGTFKRVPEVFDTWYESGSMPYAHIHYPFQNKELIDKKKKFPANFIAEGQDQTRGWFYSLLVLSTALFHQAPYENVIVHGIVLAEDGQKMSKKLKNYPEVTDVLDNYGADALRYYLLSSPVMRAEDLMFSEKGLDEIVKKMLLRLQNVFTFYSTYAHERKENKKPESKNILDIWILARLQELGIQVTEGLETYHLDAAARPFLNFIDDLSTWYLRRSRERFKDSSGDKNAEEDKQAALSTTYYVLLELTKLLAPFMPFVAEDLYQKLKIKKPNFAEASSGKESVHLENWSEFSKSDMTVIKDMEEVRKIVEIALAIRSKMGIKVRQPLKSLTLKDPVIADNAQLAMLIQDELNVKEILVDPQQQEQVLLDTNITAELKQEGQVRELIRAIQDLRKKAMLNPLDLAQLSVDTDSKGKELLEKFQKDISGTAKLSHISFISFKTDVDTSEDTEEIKVDELVFKLKLN